MLSIIAAMTDPADSMKIRAAVHICNDDASSQSRKFPGDNMKWKIIFFLMQ